MPPLRYSARLRCRMSAATRHTAPGSDTVRGVPLARGPPGAAPLAGTVPYDRGGGTRFSVSAC